MHKKALIILEKRLIYEIYWILVITKCADTGFVPPAIRAIVSAAAFPSVFLMVKVELIEVVSTSSIPII